MTGNGISTRTLIAAVSLFLLLVGSAAAIANKIFYAQADGAVVEVRVERIEEDVKVLKDVSVRTDQNVIIMGEQLKIRYLKKPND